MMKKTLLSIITVATLLGSVSVYAQPLNKDIQVEAEIHSSISLSKANGSALNDIKLSYDAGQNNGTYTHSENIKIQATNAGKIKIALAEALSLENGTNIPFTNHQVTLGGKSMLPPVLLLGNNRPINQFFDLVGNETVLELKISAQEPQGAAAGEIYSGVARFIVEETA
ncbi:CS1 type fimbrial major subunit [Yersinia kristensenii]|uniref:CS1 type fimbrial major subunit n=1 Tax=Yersinia kristensenii TaxID=28152 RepID=UPI001643AEB7|nr:CS1 type fimbrial major subunit [Yersinia kristensenii]